MVTALPLYFSSVERVVGRRALVAEIHTWAGIALPVPLIVALSGTWGARMRRDVRRIQPWTHEEIRWLVSLGRRASPRARQVQSRSEAERDLHRRRDRRHAGDRARC